MIYNLKALVASDFHSSWKSLAKLLALSPLFIARGTETIAVEEADGSYRLHGYKWFSSATDADMTFTLARIVDAQGKTVQVVTKHYDQFM